MEVAFIFHTLHSYIVVFRSQEAPDSEVGCQTWPGLFSALAGNHRQLWFGLQPVTAENAWREGILADGEHNAKMQVADMKLEIWRIGEC